jgi:DNA repair exonuclease SbcCD ATPase subunit
MVRKTGKLNGTGEHTEIDTKVETKSNLEDHVDALFRLSLPEFTGARNALAARLKKSGRGDEAVLVKALVKPSISAWAVNQLYWNHRDAFDRLIASGERFHKAQASPSAGKLANLRGALDARREALTQLSDLATSLLRDAGHSPSLDTVRRITTTLEAMSVYASRSDAPPPGRLTHDVDPPGFDSLAAFVPSASVTQPTKEPARSSQKSSIAPTNTRRKVAADDDVRQPDETRKAKIAAAKVSLQEAKRSLTEARARAQSLEVTQKKVSAEAKKAEKHRRDAEEILEKARAASEDAAQRVRSVAVEVEKAAKSVEDAKRTVEKASEELEKLFREPPAR